MQVPDIYMLILISVGFVRGRDLQRFILCTEGPILWYRQAAPPAQLHVLSTKSMIWGKTKTPIHTPFQCQLETIPSIRVLGAWSEQ